MSLITNQIIIFNSQVPTKAEEMRFISKSLTEASILLLIFYTVNTAPVATDLAKPPPLSETTETAIFNLSWKSRAAWQAAPTRHITPINGVGGQTASVPYVIVHHTATAACHNVHQCVQTVRAIQRSHQVERGWDDIGYNFLIGGDAEIYEGRGFNVSGAHAAGYNGRSLGIALIGNWTEALPAHSMLEKLQQLISYGVQMGYIQRNYKLLGHRQVKATECPGTRLFKEIKQWSHYGEPTTKSKRTAAAAAI